MGFADAGKLGVPVRPRVYSDRLPKNVAQVGVEGPVFEIGGSNPDIFNLDYDLHAKITKSEYFKCLYVFKTFDKVVDLVYEKVTYVEPWTHRGTQKRGFHKCPSSAFCLLLKLFHLQLTEDQVRALLDHPDSTYIRAIGMLYVRYGTKPRGVPQTRAAARAPAAARRRRPDGLVALARRVPRRPRGVQPGHPGLPDDDARRVRAAASNFDGARAGRERRVAREGGARIPVDQSVDAARAGSRGGSSTRATSRTSRRRCRPCSPRRSSTACPCTSRSTRT